jgi:hypothetical protein
LKKSVFVIVAALAVAGLVACGDDDDSTESTTTALSDTELISQAEAICKEHNDAIAAGFDEEGVTGNPDDVQVRALVKDYILPQYTAWIGRQEALEPPEDVAADWDTWIADSTAARDAIKDDPNVAFDASQFETVNGEAEALGLGEDCVAGPTS